MKINKLALLAVSGLLLSVVNAQDDDTLPIPVLESSMNATAKGPEMCEFTDCNLGQCMRYGGFEWCDCRNTGYAGLFCELRNATCETHGCQNNGSCTDGDGKRYCTCKPQYSGIDCENMDPDAQCADIPSDGTDMVFLPRCSLKTSLEKFSVCINDQLPFLDDDVSKCHAKITRAKQCIYKLVSDCSYVTCESVYWYGGLDVYVMVATEMSNHESNFSVAINQLFCSGPVNGSFQFPDRSFDIGEPVCDIYLIDVLLTRLIHFGNEYLRTGPDDICRKLETLKWELYNITKNSCDWSKIGDALPTLTNLPFYEKILEMSQEFFLQWFVPGCKGPEMCEYTDCNHGKCMRYGGDEWCDCGDTEFTGLFCELRNASCEDRPCENHGNCTEGVNGERYCTCMPQYSGIDCEIVDPEAQCADVPDDDMVFLPECSLKSSLQKFSVCINDQLPYLNEDVSECRAKISRTKHCIYKLVSDCSNIACDSVFMYGGLDVYSVVAPELFNPESNFSVTIEELLCTGPMNGSFQHPDDQFLIGEPVCGMDLIDKLVKSLIDYGNAYLLTGPDGICRELDTLKWQIYNITKESCDWSKIGDAFPMLTDPPRFAKILEMSQEYFLQWFVPDCEPSRCTGYCLNGGFCSEGFGYLRCACLPGWGGQRCEINDPTNVCPTAGPNDIEFFPVCTLRNTAEQVFGCVSKMIPATFGKTGYDTCKSGIYQTMTCITHVVGNCSLLVCPSIWQLDGAPETGAAIVAEMFNPTVVDRIAEHICRPLFPGQLVQFLGNMQLNKAVINLCPSVTLRNAVDLLRTVETGLLSNTDMAGMCRVIKQAQSMMYQLVDGCMVREHLSQEQHWLMPFLVKGLNVVKSMLSDYTIPMCRDTSDGCPMISPTSSRCEIEDAWMCQYFNYRKMLSQWRMDSRDWLIGCSAERDWNHWASSMGLKRGHGLTSHGEDGFRAMIKTNFPCNPYSFPPVDCDQGEEFHDMYGCRYCFRKGATGRNPRNLFMMWMQEQQQYKTMMKIYNALRQECSGSSTGCGSAASAETIYTSWSSAFSSFSSSFSSHQENP